MDLVDLSLTEMKSMLNEGRVNSEELVKACLDRIEKRNDEINAVVYLPGEDALTMAVQADRERESGKDLPPLHGLPFTVKDHLAVKGWKTTNSMVEFENQITDFDAAVVSRLKLHGAIPLGRTNLPWMAMDFQARSPVHGVTSNPWNTSHTSGGSSAGAAAVAAGMTPLDIGSDLAGSLRIPAHFCGVCSLRPTDHAVPRFGLHPAGNSPAHGRLSRNMGVPGPIARTLEDLRLVTPMLHGPVPAEPELGYMLPPTRPDGPLRFKMIANLAGMPLDSNYRKALDSFKSRAIKSGTEITEEKELPFCIAEISQTFSALLSLELMRSPLPLRILMKMMMPASKGGFTLSNIQLNHGRKNHDRALLLRDRFMSRMEEFLEGTDGLLLPVTASAAPKHIVPHKSKVGLVRFDKNVSMGDVRTTYGLGMAGLTIPFSVTGSPVATFPIGTAPNGLPLGIQAVGKRFHDLSLLESCIMLKKTMKGTN